MKGNFDDSSSQVQRLMEAIGGSADAYASPEPPPVKEVAPPSKKPNPFEDPAGGLKGKPLAMSREVMLRRAEAEGDSEVTAGSLDPDALAGIEGEEPTPEDSAAAGDSGWDCGFTLADDKPSPPQPLSEEYRYHDIVDACGELKAVWDAFCLVVTDQEPKQVTLDSGTFEVTKSQGSWVLSDPHKNYMYVLEVGNLAGHLKLGERLIWVSNMENQTDFGYIHQGYVFLKA